MQTQDVAAEKGVSLKTTSIIMMIVSLVITAVLLFMAFRTFRSFRNMEASTDDFIQMEEAADELMQASDYLTEEAQCYTVLGDRTHMENYFTEADVTRRREHAISVMEEAMPDSPALTKLKEGMAESLSLMNREYYAMRLMMEAQGDADMPKALKNVTLTEADSALAPEEKILLAQRMVHDKVYSEQKTQIRNNMAECIKALKSGTHGASRRPRTKRIVI